MGVNHLGNQKTAIELVDSAIDAGSDFVKLQTYDPKKRYDKKIQSMKNLQNLYLIGNYLKLKKKKYGNTLNQEGQKFLLLFMI